LWNKALRHYSYKAYIWISDNIMVRFGVIIFFP
jgi:hypothetical protein